jgi:hypothetical protein
MLGQQLLLGQDHVVVGILRECHAEAVARATTRAVPNPIRQHDVVRAGIEWPAFSKQRQRETLAGARPQERAAGAGRAMHHEDGVCDQAGGRVALRLSEGRVVLSQLQGLAALKRERRHEVTFALEMKRHGQYASSCRGSLSSSRPGRWPERDDPSDQCRDRSHTAVPYNATIRILI